MNRMIEEYKPARSTDPAHQDVLAGLGAGLKNFYTYDQVGNLTQEIKDSRGDVTKPNHNGLMTNYLYDSRTKVIAESRPYFAGTTTYKLNAYRLDGAKIAMTTYDYGGNLRSGTVPGLTTPPTVSSGNATIYDLDKRGYTHYEVSLAPDTNCRYRYVVQIPTTTGNYNCAEHMKEHFYNGLGKVTMREYFGQNAINPGTIRQMYWFYDANFNLVKSYNQNKGSTIQEDVFTYSYSPTNKETYQTRDVKDDTHSSSITVDNGITAGSVTTTYNERDLTASVSLSDSSVVGRRSAGLNITSSQTSTYHLDSLMKRVDTSTTNILVGGTSYRQFTYDTRRRVITDYDRDGTKTYSASQGDLQTQAFQSLTTRTIYGAAGVITQRVESANCRLATKTTPTINGLTWKYEEWDRNVGTCETDGQQSKRNAYTYTSRGQLAINDEITRDDTDGQSSTPAITTLSKYNYAYDVYNNQTSEFLAQTVGTVNRPRKEVKTTTYNGINAATTVIARPFDKPDTTIAYTLDSLGNRIYVGGTENDVNKFYGYIKRYDANGRVLALTRVRYIDNNTNILENYTGFRYDPFGHEVLSSSTEIKWTLNCGSSCKAVRVERATFATIYSGNDVVATRVRGAPETPGAAIYESGTDGVAINTSYDRYDRIKNESFSMADTLTAVPWGVVNTFTIESPTSAFEAPVESLSTTLQLDPLEVRPPDAATPGQPSEDAGDITPPSGEETQPNADEQTSEDSQAPAAEQTPTDGQTNSNNVQASNVAVNAPLPALNANTLAAPSADLSTDTSADSAGVALPDATSATTPLPTTTALDASTLNSAPLTTPTTLTALPDLGEVPTTDTPAPGDTTSTTNEGDSALPESITQLSSSDITLPETSLPTAFDATSPGDITSPDDASVPTVGLTASDSPLDVVMPESLSADVPTIGNGTPEAIAAVVPPTEWLAQKDAAMVTALANSAGDIGTPTKSRPRDNDQQTSTNRYTSQGVTGRKNSPSKQKDVDKKQETNSYGKASTAGTQDKAERNERR